MLYSAGLIKDDLGALYYVVAVIVIYGFSIVMMIASYIRKNKDDRRLKRYLQEMAFVRKRDRHMALMWAATKAANLRRNALTPSQASCDPQNQDPLRSGAEDDEDDEKTKTVWVLKQSSDEKQEQKTDETNESASSKRRPRGQKRGNREEDVTAATRVSFSRPAALDRGRHSLDSSAAKFTRSTSGTQIMMAMRTMAPGKIFLTVPNEELTKITSLSTEGVSSPLCHTQTRKHSCPSLQVVSTF